MQLEIRNPELVQRVNAHIRSRRLHDADELLDKALDALDEQTIAAAPKAATGAFVLAALQARRCRPGVAGKAVSGRRSDAASGAGWQRT